MSQYILYREGINKYIGYSDTQKVIRVDKLEDAYRFNSPNQARNARKKASKKMAYFHVYMLMDDEKVEKVSANISKRKSFTKEDRIRIYRKTKGHCYLCGDFVDFDSFEIEHRMPLSKGGTNDFNNLYPSCHICNTIKHDIYPEDFVETISKIFMFQMRIKNKKCFKWKIVHKLLQEMI